jgi:hypothetical protein
VGTGGAVVFAAPALATSSVLTGMGFTAGGVKAGMYKISERTYGLCPMFGVLRLSNGLLWTIGSIAAAAQGLIGNVAAGSAFAVGQSAGAGGASFAVASGAAQVGGAVMSVGSAGLAWAKSKL